ncbi:type II toxin-antitoxin system ParD family antitoxin [Sphingomonas sp. M1-B02]|uniref:type II toxin-antitoxin system ParD family antitoxin n=1 Tax=Sphingomonas sp. M1-B02 TaxID=3114300 RepID=UPI00223FD301|nr:type II toxin-antitoxin system ParD family antitoxin [Sphingomonas sp. S6-11]UZK65657.1 type II toxin-antitoxin system ParD family antitoxin [Sphingomonas sp. S6-11]
MDISLDPHWQDFVDTLVQAGRYETSGDVVNAGLRLVEEREAKLAGLRDTINASIERDEWRTDEEVGARVRATIDRWKQANGG